MTIEEAFKQIIKDSPSVNHTKVRYRLRQLVNSGVPVHEAFAGLDAVVKAEGLSGKKGGGDVTAQEAIARTERDYKDEYGFMANSTQRWG